jgi:uridylate kinase
MLKLSGEALEGNQKFGIDPDVLQTVAHEVAEASSHGVQIAIVVGGGNFFRGVNRWDGLERTTADYVGMLATVMNAIALQSALEKEGVQVRTTWRYYANAFQVRTCRCTGPFPLNQGLPVCTVTWVLV